MSPSNKPLTFTQTIQAPIAQAYRAFTNATDLRGWLCDLATVEVKEGGRFYLAWNSGYYTSGAYLTLDENKSLSFNWHGRDEPAPTQVEVNLSGINGSTRVALKHNGLGTGDAWEVVAQEIEKGWNNALENLKSFLETGEDLRFTRRPMLGIVLSDFNAEIAEQLGIPVTKGIRIDNVVDGMGAKAAGLQQDDVVVAMAGKPITGWSDLAVALNGQRAGDQIDVEFYRSAEKITVKMTLSGRPMPELPTTVEGLAKAAKERYQRLQEMNDQFFKGVSEAEASFKPAPDEWSVKEVLAHILQGERFYQGYIQELVGGHERWADDWGGNIQAAIDATVTVYPTLKDLRDALSLSREESAALFAHLPADFAQQKGTFWRLAYEIVEDPYHDQTHFEQMQRAIDAARAK